MNARAAVALGAALFAAGARADPFPARQGTSGLLDVPDANVLDPGASALGAELRLESAPRQPRSLGPSPLTIGLGLGRGVEVGLALREGGLPGDPRPSQLLVSGALKLRVFESGGALPSLALLGTVDRINGSARSALDLVASTQLAPGIRGAALLGLENRNGPFSTALGGRAGGAIAFRHASGAEVALQALHGPGGALLGGALRWAVREDSGISLGLQWQPRDGGLRLSFGFAFSSALPRPPAFAVEQVPPAAPAKAEEAKPGARLFRDPFPRLRLKVKPVKVPGEEANPHLQWPAAPAEAPADGKPKEKSP